MSDEEKRVETKLRPILRKYKGKVNEPYRILAQLLAECEEFAPLRDAEIRLFYRKDWPIDADGVVTGAQCAKATEVERLEAEAGGNKIDLKILLPEETWPTLDDTEKEHRIYHELSHFAPARDAEGKQKHDTKDRPLWRMKRHQIVAFHQEVERYGVERILCHNDAMVRQVAQADRPMERLFDQAEAKTNGDWRSTAIADLNLPATTLAKLAKVDVETIGALNDRVKQHGDFWWKDITGLGEKGAEKIANALVDFWGRHPEYCQ